MAASSCPCWCRRTWWDTNSASSRRPAPSPATRATKRRSGPEMSRPGYLRALADNEAQAILSNIRISPRKLNLVAAMIRNLPAADAVATLTFSKRRIAQQVRKALESAIANAENNHQLAVDRLMRSRAEAGRAAVMRRFHARGRGRSCRVWQRFSHLKVLETDGE